MVIMMSLPPMTTGPSRVVFAPQPVHQEVQQPVRQRAQEQVLAVEVAVEVGAEKLKSEYCSES